MNNRKFYTMLLACIMMWSFTSCSNETPEKTTSVPVTTETENESVETTVEETTALETTIAENVAETATEITEPFVRPECNVAQISCSIGDTVEYGSYYSSGEEMSPITWTCMDEQDGMVLLLSNEAIDCRMYNDRHESTSWAECDLRQWLNSEFIDIAFTEEEASCIWYSDIVNENNNTGLVDGGVDTIDQIFILSCSELESYFPDDSSRLCFPTDYAIENGCWISSFNSSLGCTSYWVRNPGLAQVRAVYVFLNGAIINEGDFVNQTFIGVRPAMWVKIA